MMHTNFSTVVTTSPRILSAVDVEPESGRYVRVDRPDSYFMLVRGCRVVSPYRAGFEDFEYNKVYSNPFRVGSPRWHQYDMGNEDARKTKRELQP